MFEQPGQTAESSSVQVTHERERWVFVSPPLLPPRFRIDLFSGPPWVNSLRKYNLQAGVFVFHGQDLVTGKKITMKMSVFNPKSDSKESVKKAALAEQMIQKVGISGAWPILFHYQLDKIPNWLAVQLPDLSEWSAVVSIMPTVQSEFFLTNRLKRSGFKVNDALQIAENLAVVIQNHEQYKIDTDGSDSPVNHGDLSPDNIVVTDDLEVYLIDYDASNIAGNKTRGKLGYCHPLLFEETMLANSRTDTYSFVVILFELITGEKLFYQKASESEEQFIMRRKKTVKLPESKDKTLRQTLQEQNIHPDRVIALMNRGLNPLTGFASPKELMSELKRAIGRQLAA